MPFSGHSGVNQMLDSSYCVFVESEAVESLGCSLPALSPDGCSVLSLSSPCAALLQEVSDADDRMARKNASTVKDFSFLNRFIVIRFCLKELKIQLRAETRVTFRRFYSPAKPGARSEQRSAPPVHQLRVFEGLLFCEINNRFSGLFRERHLF